MNFLNQALLWGMAAISIPVLIHLLNRRRYRRVPWAAMRFLKISVDQNQRRMRLEDWILLLLRCAVVALLASLLARPVLEGVSGVPGSKVAAAIIVDNSASMGSQEGGVTRLALAREADHEILSGLPQGSPVVVGDVFRAHEASADHEFARARIDAITQTERHADLILATKEAIGALEGQAVVDRELYVITDGHAEEWGSLAALGGRFSDITAGVRVQLITVGSSLNANLGISRLTPAAALPAVDQPFRIDVDVTNFGEAPVTRVPVKVLVDGQASGNPWIIEELGPGRSETATLYTALPGPGYHRVTVALEGDKAPFDDRQTVVMRARDEVNVLLVDGEPGAEDRDSETFFLREALAPVPPAERSSYPVKPRVVSGSNLEAEALDRYEAVVLANVADVSLAFADRLVRFVEKGGGLVVFPGGNFRPESYNALLYRRHGLLPASFVPREGDIGPRTRSLIPAETNPLSLERDLLAGVKFRQIQRLQLGEGDYRVNLRYDDGQPALVESNYGQGKVFVFTSSADLAWNDFAVRPAYVPFVSRVLGGIVPSRENNLNVAAGDPVRYRLDARLVGRDATVYELEDPESLGRLTELSGDDGVSLLEFDRTDRAGPYQVTIAGEPEPLLFSVRPSERESSVALLGDEQLARLGDSVTVSRWASNGKAASLEMDRQGAELWWPLLLVVIALAAVEMTLAQWFSRSK
ncbi:MAG: hypothetical protein CMP27_07880 [Roseibacillus sp.]|nr:hypothetical protein [Roseibacillus sp.]